jgi:hypothetical protein
VIICGIFFIPFWRRRSPKEEEISHLVSTTDEISVLEQARSSLIGRDTIKATPSIKKLQPKKSIATKSVKQVPEISTKKTPSTTQKAPVKSVKKTVDKKTPVAKTTPKAK